MTKLCECGSPALVVRWKSDGSTTPSCEAERAKYLALYGAPATFTWEAAPC
jgi:hypothetical protein